MTVTCLDFEGVLIPEIWKGLAQLTKIDDLKLTTRDISDYSELMNYRLKILSMFFSLKPGPSSSIINCAFCFLISQITDILL